MNASTSAEQPCRFGLQGEVDGSSQTFLLRPGVNRVGSRGGAHIQLAVPGVSKRHALILVQGGELQVEDLGSKNGTFLNGSPCHSEALRPGDELVFGPVALRLDELSAREGVLAISLSPGAGDAAATGFGSDTSRLHSGDGGPALGWLDLMAELHERVSCEPDRLGEPLAQLVQGLGAAGGVILESLHPRPVVLATVGDLEEARNAAALLAQNRSGEEPSGGVGVRFAEASRGSAMALYSLASSSSANSGAVSGPCLALWGDYPGREASAPVLRAFLSLVLLARTSAPARAKWASTRRRHSPSGPSGALRFPEDYVPGTSPAMEALYRELRALASADLPILLTGETGVGKEPLAKTIHLSSGRRTGPFVPINCAAIPAELLEAELFGIGKGVATGVKARAGKFQQAEGGTLFLDEISELAQELQAKLLRALQEQEVHPVGGGAVPVNVRIVSATNGDLQQQMDGGSFRRDLFYRLAGRVVRVPPLRERPRDLPALVEHFLARSARHTDKAVRGISLKALERLQRHPWPGNVRELEHEVYRLVLLCPEGQPVTSALMSDGPILVAEAPAEAAAAPLGPAVVDPSEGSLDLATLERRTIETALERTEGNQSQAAKLVGLSREALRRRMKAHGLL